MRMPITVEFKAKLSHDNTVRLLRPVRGKHHNAHKFLTDRQVEAAWLAMFPDGVVFLDSPFVTEKSGNRMVTVSVTIPCVSDVLKNRSLYRAEHVARQQRGYPLDECASEALRLFHKFLLDKWSM